MTLRLIPIRLHKSCSPLTPLFDQTGLPVACFWRRCCWGKKRVWSCVWSKITERTHISFLNTSNYAGSLQERDYLGNTGITPGGAESCADPFTNVLYSLASRTVCLSPCIVYLRHWKCAHPLTFLCEVWRGRQMFFFIFLCFRGCCAWAGICFSRGLISNTFIYTRLWLRTDAYKVCPTIVSTL